MIPYIERELSRGTRLHSITRHVLGLFRGVPGARAFRRHLASEAVKAGAPDPFLPLRWLKFAAIIRWERKLAPTFKRLIERYVPEMEREAVTA